MAKTKAYDNESISSLKGADRVRLRPGVIFGSDDLEGCQHSFFEILSNSIDEAREGYGNQIEVTPFQGRFDRGPRLRPRHSARLQSARKSATTGNWSTANSMPAANTTTTAATPMNTAWA